MRKLVEKVMAEQLSIFCEANKKLHVRQIEAQKSRYAVNAIVIMVNSIHALWEKKKIMETLFIDIKRVLDHVSSLKLA